MITLSHPKVITLCGSHEFVTTFNRIKQVLTRQGLLVLTPNFKFNASPTKKALLNLQAEHFHRIHLADEVLIIDVNSYVGHQTQREIAFARTLGKPILYYSDHTPGNQQHSAK